MAGAIACQPQSSDSPTAAPSDPVTASPSPTEPQSSGSSTSTATPIETSQAVYENQRFSFQFNYPERFVVIEQPDVSDSSNGRSFAAIQIWSEADNNAIQSGEYEGGTEYPPNTSITIIPNPEQKLVTEWINSNEWLTQPDEYQPIDVAGQSAIAFHSTGLYEMDHVAFPTPDGANIVLITVDREGGDGYKAAYDAIVGSFQFK